MRIALEMSGFKSIPEDSEIYIEGNNIKRVLFGIDIEESDIYMAKMMGYDAVISHHPLASCVNAYKVYKDHVKLMVKAGVPEEIALKAVEDKMENIKITASSSNYDRVVSVARLLGMPLLNIHQPLDEIGRRIMQEKVDKVLEKQDATLEDILDGLYEIEEFKRARTDVSVLIGDRKSIAGKTVVAHGAYTNGGYEVARAYYKAGVKTVIYIHISYADYKKLKDENMGNLIVTGHIASDSVGINPFVNRLRKEGLEVTTFSGII